MWKGTISLGAVHLPVKLYSAVQDKGIHFTLLDRKRKEPVVQHMINPETNEIVDHEKIHSAFERGGELVMLDDEELDKLDPEPSRDIEITRFVPQEKITHQWYERPYFLGPDGDGTRTYFALVEALKNQEMEGVARWTMRKKEYVGALRAEGDYLMLITLRHRDEVIPAAALEPPGGRPLDKREIEMAKQLVGSLEGELDMSQFRDEYRDRVLEYVDAKAKGKILRLPKPKEKRADASLESVLERSLANAKRRKSA